MIAEKEISQTQIMRRANLKTAQAKSYIIFARDRGWLLEPYNLGARRYKRTMEGWYFLRLLAEVTRQLDGLDVLILSPTIRLGDYHFIIAIDLDFAQSFLSTAGHFLTA